MKDLIDSLRLHIFERLSSPLFGAFCVAWLAWNHDYVFIMFSGIPIDERLAMAKSVVYPDWWAVALRGAAYPFLSAVAFILIYPFPAKWLFGYWHQRQAELKKLRDEIEGATLLTLDESRKVRSAMLAACRTWLKGLAKMVVATGGTLE